MLGGRMNNQLREWIKAYWTIAAVLVIAAVLI